MAVIHGCQVNLRYHKKGQLMRKGWKLMTTHKRVAEMMNLPCRCPKSYQHAVCEGDITRKSAYYTPEFVQRFVAAIKYEMGCNHLKEEFLGHDTRLPRLFGGGCTCYCKEVHNHGVKMTCGSCHMDPVGLVGIPDHVHEGYVHECSPKDPKDDNMIRRQLYLLHAATGHSSVRNMVLSLQKRGASKSVLDMARDFKCSVCETRQKMNTKHVSTLEPLPAKWSVVCADGGTWTHEGSQETVGFAVLIDEGCRFRTARILSRGRKQTMNTSQFIQSLKEGWFQYFGKPQTLRLDPAGAFRSNEVEAFCDVESIFLDFIPAEAHWKFGICEQAIRGLKEVMNKLVDEDPSIPPEDALSTVVRTFNHRETVRGFSPVQHALGIAPDETGRFISSVEGRHHEAVIGNPTGEFQESIERMKTAEQTHSGWLANKRSKKALNSRSQRTNHYHPGDLVYYWRKQLPKSMVASKTGGFLGPARVLVTETKREADGQLRAGSTVWVVRGRRLLKCCVKQLRPATERESLLEHVITDEDNKASWTIPRLVDQLGSHEYEDITGQVPSLPEWEQGQNEDNHIPMVPVPTPRVRHWHKRPLDPAESGDMETQGSMTRSRGEPATGSGFETEAWWSNLSFRDPTEEATAYWSNHEAAVEVAIDMPTSNRGWKHVENDMTSYFVAAMRRRAVELSERRMDPETRAQFEGAKGAEEKNFIAAKTFEILPDYLQPPREQAIGMRWILTWKLKDDGTRKPKARAILLGYQDPGYEHRATTTLVMTKQSRQMLLQVAAIRKWITRKGDVSGAFLQGREYPIDLFCVPCPEICQAMGISENSITRVKRGCYGLVDAPIEWYRSVSDFFQSLGLVKTWSDPCMWLWKPNGQLRGMISCHVDDFMFTGGRDDPEWDNILAKIQSQYAWGSWETGKFVQCGVVIEQQADNSYHLSQPTYMEKVTEIPISASRRKETQSELSGREQTQLRAVLGSLSWHAQQVAPYLSAEIGLLLSEIAKGSVDTILKTNKLIYAARQRKHHKMIIHHFPPDVELGLFVWADAAVQNRKDGSSTQGLFLGMAPTSLLEGHMERVTPISWHATKIERVVRSPGAAEASAVVNGEDLLFHARYQWGEIMGPPVDVFDINTTVNLVVGGVISDSRNVYDRLQTEEFNTQGAERRTSLELMCLKHAQRCNQVHLRRVHSEAQLGNALTKPNAKELEHFYQLGCRWRIVSDDEMRSARKRKKEGMETLANHQRTPSAQERNVTLGDSKLNH